MSSSIQGNAVSFWAVEQVSPSAGIPATPAWTNLRRNSGDIDVQKSFTQSEEVDVTRQPGYNIITGSSISGNIASEMSVADPAFKLVSKSALQNSGSNVISSTGSTTFANATSEVTQIGAFSDAVVGQYFYAFDSVLNARVFKITAITDADTVTVSPAPVDETISATLSGESVRNSNLQVALGVQKRIPTDANTVYKTFEGCQVGSLSISVSTESIVNVTYDITGLTKVDGVTQIAGSTDNAISSTRVSGSVKDVMEFWVDGVPSDPATVCYTDFTIDLDNGTQENPALGKEGACSLSFGSATISGSLMSYVDGTDETTAQSEINKRDNETLFGLGVVLKDVDGNMLVIDLPSTQYTEVTQDETANGDVLKNNGSYSATGKPEGYAVAFNFIAAA